MVRIILGNTRIIGYILGYILGNIGLYRENGKENGNYGDFRLASVLLIYKYKKRNG